MAFLLTSQRNNRDYYSIHGQLDKRPIGNSGSMEDGRNTEDVTVIMLLMTMSRISDGKVMLHTVIR